MKAAETGLMRRFIANEWPRIAVVVGAFYKTKSPLQALDTCLTDYRLSCGLSQGINANVKKQQQPKSTMREQIGVKTKRLTSLTLPFS